MIDPLSFDVGVSEAGQALGVPWPELTRAWWLDGPPSPVAASNETAREGATIRTVPEEGGLAWAAAVPGGMQVRMVLTGAWDVLFVDSFDAVAAVGAPCSLILQVYEEDGVTLAWEVGTSPDHDNPYLALPSNYSTQEVDFIRGGATIGQVEVAVVDKAQTPGDQASGWMTERLVDGGVPAIRNRRCRLLRHISPELGSVVIIDGPAGAPRLDSTYAGYRWVIKDPRENERKLQAFTRTDVWALPAGLEGGWGSYQDSEGAEQWLIPPTEPLVGTYRIQLDVGVLTLEDYWQDAFTAIGVPTTGVVSDRAVEFPGSSYSDVFVSPGEYLGDGSFRAVYEYRDLQILWRPEGTLDPWNVVEPRAVDPVSRPDTIFPRPIMLYAGPNGEGQAGSISAEFNGVGIFAAFKVLLRGLSEEATVDPYNPVLVDGTFPTVGQRVEFAVRYRGAPTEEMPLFLEYDTDGSRLTAGRLLQQMYDGEHSEPDPDTGEPVPSGIRYDQDALLEMTEPVRAMITGPVDDMRQWTESQVYAPTGRAPTFDLALRISPTSQVPPESFDGLAEVNDLNASPEPNWDAGETIINRLTFTYPRYFLPAGTEPIARIGGLLSRDVVLDYRSSSSLTGQEYAETLDGSAFAAIGSEDGVALEQELGAQLAELRRLYLFDRYNTGAQVIQVPVRRVDSALWRAGEWRVVDLSWIPDYILRRRGGLWGGQIMSIADLNCAWRVVLMEEAVPLERPPVS